MEEVYRLRQGENRGRKRDGQQGGRRPSPRSKPGDLRKHRLARKGVPTAPRELPRKKRKGPRCRSAGCETAKNAGEKNERPGRQKREKAKTGSKDRTLGQAWTVLSARNRQGSAAKRGGRQEMGQKNGRPGPRGERDFLRATGSKRMLQGGKKGAPLLQLEARRQSE